MLKQVYGVMLTFGMSTCYKKIINMKLLHVFTVFTTPKSFFDGQFKYIAEKGHDVIFTCSMVDGANEFAERNGIRYIPVSMPRAMAPCAILKAIRDLIKVIRQEKPDAVFGHTPVGALCAMIAAKWCGVKNRIYYRHGVIYTTMKGIKFPIFRLEEKFVASLATAVVNVSHSLSNLAIRDGLNPESKNNVIGHGTCGGIDARNIFNPSLINADTLESMGSALSLQDADVIFGFCGRFCKDKGTPELVDAFELLQSKHPEVKIKLVLIGRFDERDLLSVEKKQQIENNNDIVVTGYIQKEEIPCYYSLLDVFVFPSHREGFGMVAIEASAMEKPLLVSKVHGCEDTIVEHVTGEYVPLTAEGICEGMEKMLDLELREFLGKNGRKNVLDWYDFRVMWPLVSEVYKKILK